MPPVTKKLSDLTAHNVSSSPNYNKATHPTLFTGQTNHDGSVLAVDATLMDNSENASAPMNTSKESVHTMLPSTWAGRIIMYLQFWWGRSNHPDIGINSRDPATVQAILQDIKDRGYDVVSPDWYHPTLTNVYNDSDLDLLDAGCKTVGLKWCLTIDQGYFGDKGSTAATMQADIISAINGRMDKYASSTAYEKAVVGGVARPLVLLWDVAAVAGANVNWTSVKSATASHSNPLLIQYQATGFNVASSDGSFSWIDSNADSAGKPPSGSAYLTSSFFPACNNNKSKICISSAWKGFNGTITGSTAWSLGKYISQQQGFTWVDMWNANNNFIAGGGKLDYIGIVTWDDYQEGSAVQTGIRTNVAISAALSSGIITFSVTGDERTVRQYNLWGTTDGVNITQLAVVFPGVAKQFDLSKLPGLTASGNYTLYVEAQGMPSLQNHLASQTFTQTLTVPGNTPPPPAPPPPAPPPPTPNPPIAVLTADSAGGVAPATVNFDGSNSTDPNGTINSYRFDFGDGSAPQVDPVLNTASHTYTKAGTFLAQLTVTDNAGNVGADVVTITVTVTQAAPPPPPGLPPPPPPPPKLPTGDPLNPIPVVTPSPVPTPDPRRSLCQRFKDRFKKG